MFGRAFLLTIIKHPTRVVFGTPFVASTRKTHLKGIAWGDNVGRFYCAGTVSQVLKLFSQNLREGGGPLGWRDFRWDWCVHLLERIITFSNIHGVAVFCPSQWVCLHCFALVMFHGTFFGSNIKWTLPLAHFPKRGKGGKALTLFEPFFGSH